LKFFGLVWWLRVNWHMSWSPDTALAALLVLVPVAAVAVLGVVGNRGSQEMVKNLPCKTSFPFHFHISSAESWESSFGFQKKFCVK
jgi:hypothetical protein